jgi:hypothetical protein
MKKKRLMPIAAPQAYVYCSPKRLRKLERLLKKHYEIETAKNKAAERTD